MVQGFYNAILNCFKSVGFCLLLSTAYVASLYIWKSPHNRDHPSTIKKRFISVFFMVIISPCFLYFGLNSKLREKLPISALLGFKLEGLCQAVIIPLILTMILFLGPMTMKLGKFQWKQCTNPGHFKDLIWLRNHIVAPFSEELTYRSCMLPLLLQCFPAHVAIIVCPLFFGVAHFHHIQERLKSGMDLRTSLQIACFQFGYTTVFGMYSAFLLFRTGHFAATFVVHAFCNFMGFPDLAKIATYQRKERVAVVSLFIVGFVAWCYLVTPLTQAHLYDNAMQWEESA